MCAWKSGLHRLQPLLLGVEPAAAPRRRNLRAGERTLGRNAAASHFSTLQVQR